MDEIKEVKKKGSNKAAIGIVLAILVIGGYMYYSNNLRIEERIEEEAPFIPIPEGKSEGGLELKACVSDAEGNCLSIMSNTLYLGGRPKTRKTLSYIEVQGDPICYGSRYVTITHTLTKTGTVPNVNVIDIAGTPTPFQTQIDSDMTKAFILTTTPNVQSATGIDTDGLPRNTLSTWTPFTETITAEYKSATGGTVPVTPTPTAVLNIRLMDDECSDGTNWNTCKSTPANTLNFCEAGTAGCVGSGGVEGSMVTDCRGPDNIAGNADDCGCLTGYTCESDGSCSQDKCSDGTIVGQCVSPTPTGNLQANPNANIRYCAVKNQPLVEDCTKSCGIPNNGFYCAKDWYDANPTGCSAGICQYTSYTGGINVTVA